MPDDTNTNSTGEVTYKAEIKRYTKVSSHLSDVLRPIGIGVVVFCWELLTADKGLALRVATSHRLWIVVTAAIAILGLALDLGQGAAAYWVVDSLLRQMEKDGADKGSYNGESFASRSNLYFFFGKAILMPIAAASIVVLLFLMVL